MKSKIQPHVKICCISSQAEAQLAIDCGASALGLVGPMPSGPGIIDNQQIKEIASAVPPPISTFLLTSETNAADIINHYKKVNTSVIQMVDALTDNGYVQIKQSFPHVKLVQVIHVIDKSSIEQAQQAAQFVDAILLDSGNPGLSIKELGGTGRTHDWQLSKMIKEKINIPLFLAGGIGPDNVIDAIRTVQPFGIDLCSSVRTNNQLDATKLKALFTAISQA